MSQRRARSRGPVRGRDSSVQDTLSCTEESRVSCTEETRLSSVQEARPSLKGRASRPEGGSMTTRTTGERAQPERSEGPRARGG